MNDLWIETGSISMNKHGETLCGDKVELAGGGDEDLTLVLADGLGSGVKANILSTLTSKILCTMISGGIPLEECVSTIASTLPVCSVRKVAYSTFTIIRILDNKTAHIIQFDNPAHQNPNLPITFGIKQQLITSLADCLRKMGKHVRLSYF